MRSLAGYELGACSETSSEPDVRASFRAYLRTRTKTVIAAGACEDFDTRDPLRGPRLAAALLACVCRHAGYIFGALVPPQPGPAGLSTQASAVVMTQGAAKICSSLLCSGLASEAVVLEQAKAARVRIQRSSSACVSTRADFCKGEQLGLHRVEARACSFEGVRTSTERFKVVGELDVGSCST